MEAAGTAMKPIKHHLVFLSMLTIGGFVWFQMALYLAHEWFGYNPEWGYLQYCLSFLKEKTLWHRVMVIGLNALIAYSFGMLVFVMGRQWRISKRWLREISIRRDDRLTARVNGRYPYFRNKIVVIREDKLAALTSGFFRPIIVISSQTVEQFGERELAAILWHENCHCRHHDPLRLLLLEMMRSSLPFIPILKRPVSYIWVAMELQADQYSVKRMHSAYYLANVLLFWSRSPVTVAGGVGFADKAINYRLLQLIEPDKKLHVPLWEASSSLYSAVIVIMIAGIVASGCS